MTREEILKNLVEEFYEDFNECERAQHLLDCEYCELYKKYGRCHLGEHITEYQMPIIKKAQIDLLKEFAEYLKSTKKYQAIDEDNDTAGVSWGRCYTLPHHQLDRDLEKFLEERK